MDNNGQQPVSPQQPVQPATQQPQPVQPPYGQPQMPPVPHQPAPGSTNGMATAAMVLGIIGVATFWIPVINWVSFILAILAIIFGGIGVYKKAGAKATTGLILGIATIILTIGIYIFWVNTAKEVLQNTNLRNYQQYYDYDY